MDKVQMLRILLFPAKWNPPTAASIENCDVLSKLDRAATFSGS
jgi:hypothetical protein